jgi:hypothetical protein
MRQVRDFWTERRVRIAADKYAHGDEPTEIAAAFDVRVSLVRSIMVTRPDLFPLRRALQAKEGQ